MKLIQSFSNIYKCRSCSSKRIVDKFNLGHQCFGGIFPSSRKQKVPSGPLYLVKCSNCHLIQLKHNFNRKKMFGSNYGYRSGINKSMQNHLKYVLKDALNFVSLRRNDAVIDIGSNDGTLLNFFKNKNQKLYGIDPTIAKFKKYYNKTICRIPSLFNDSVVANLKKNFKTKKAKIIFSLAMFYDLPNPIKFAENIKKVISNEGVWILEQSYYPLMLKNNSFDTICHEHLEYYTIRSIKYIFEKTGFKIIDIKFNDVNGGSFKLVVASKNSKLKEFKQLKLFEEREVLLLKKYKFKQFIRNIDVIKFKLMHLLTAMNSQKKNIYGYGASTKGNVLLQYFGIKPKLIPYISEVNEYKFNRYTPSTKIKILDHNLIRKKLPDFFLVLPWHFKNNILKKDISFLKQGVKYIFPLPNITIYSYKKNKMNVRQL